MMDYITVNYVAVLAAAVASMVIGFLWYSPMILGNQWMKLMGLTKAKMESAKKEMGKMYVLSLIATLVTAYVLAHFVAVGGALSAADGATVAFWAWLGFIAPVLYTDVLFGGKSVNLYLINVGYQLAAMVAMGAILGGM